MGSKARWVAVLLVMGACTAGCTEDFWLGRGRYLSFEQTAGSVSPKASEYAGRAFHLVRVNQLRQLRDPLSLTYLGSDERFHYLRVWNKAVRAGEVQYVVLNRPDCDVSDPATLESERTYQPEHFTYHPWRKVVIRGNACVVRPWSEEPSARPYRVRLPPKT